MIGIAKVKKVLKNLVKSIFQVKGVKTYNFTICNKDIWATKALKNPNFQVKDVKTTVLTLWDRKNKNASDVK
jgi:hypothetical protein